MFGLMSGQAAQEWSGSARVVRKRKRIPGLLDPEYEGLTLLQNFGNSLTVDMV